MRRTGLSKKMTVKELRAKYPVLNVKYKIKGLPTVKNIATAYNEGNAIDKRAITKFLKSLNKMYKYYGREKSPLPNGKKVNRFKKIVNRTEGVKIPQNLKIKTAEEAISDLANSNMTFRSEKSKKAFINSISNATTGLDVVNVLSDTEKYFKKDINLEELSTVIRIAINAGNSHRQVVDVLDANNAWGNPSVILGGDE